MKFTLIDEVLERTPERIVARKQVSLAEEYLADHFPTFPILPGVMMLEVMVQAARRMLDDRPGGPHVLGEARSVKYGAMVRPGETLEVVVTLDGTTEDGGFRCRGTGRVLGPGRAAAGKEETAVSGRFTMRPIAAG